MSQEGRREREGEEATVVPSAFHETKEGRKEGTCLESGGDGEGDGAGDVVGGR